MDLAAFAAWLRAEGLAATTITAYVGHVRAMLRAQPDGDVCAWATRRLGDAPAGTARAIRHALRRWLRFRGIDPATVALPSGKRTPRRLRSALNAEELELYERAVREARISSATRTILLLLPLTGLRIHEACQLRYRDLRVIDGARGLFIHGKGEHERFVPLLESAAQLLDGYVATYATGLSVGEGFLFRGRAGGHIQPDSVRKPLRELRTAREVIPHVLRHTFATRCLHGGMPLPTLQRILGHADLRTTAIYLHVRPIDAAEALRRAWGGGGV